MRHLLDKYIRAEEMEVVAAKIDTAVRHTKKANWVGSRIKEREVANAIREESAIA